MEKFSQRLDRRVREAAEGRPGVSRAGVSRAAGMNESWVRDLIEERTRMPNAEALERLAAALDTTTRWLLTGEEQGENIRGVPLVGYVGAGAEIIIVDDHAKGAGLDEVEAPPGARSGTVAVRVRGGSMMGRYDPGDVIYYSEQLPPDSLVNKRECVVKLGDGRLFVKRLRRGSARGLYSLDGVHGPVIEDVAVEWVARIDASKPAY